MNFLEKLDVLMAEKNLNKNTLSLESEIPYTTIDGWYKKGYSNLKLPSVQKLADYFGVSLDYLANDEISDKNYGRTNGFELSFSEMEHIKKYRTLDERGKDTVNTILNSEYERAVESQNVKTEQDKPVYHVKGMYAARGKSENIIDAETTMTAAEITAELMAAAERGEKKRNRRR